MFMKKKTSAFVKFQESENETDSSSDDDEDDDEVGYSTSDSDDSDSEEGSDHVNEAMVKLTKALEGYAHEFVQVCDIAEKVAQLLAKRMMTNAMEQQKPSNE